MVDNKIGFPDSRLRINREFAHAWARCAFGGRIAHFQALFVHNSTYLVAERSTFYYHHIFNILSMIII